MTEVQLLFLVLVLLYAWECLCWLRPGCVAFTTWLGWNWRDQNPGKVVGNDKGGFIFAAPLPPLGTLLTTNQFPLSCSTESLLSYVSTTVNPGPRPAQILRLVRMDQIAEIHAHGKSILINGEKFLVLGSTTWARLLAKQLNHLRILPVAQREAAIAAIHRETFETKAVEKRWQEFQKLAAPIRTLANVLFIYLFALAPTAIWLLGLRLSWLGLLIGLLLLTTATAFFFRRAHRTLFPNARDECFTHTMTILLSPVTAVRAHDVLARPLLETFHPLATGKVLIEKDQFKKLARRVLLDMRHPALPICPLGDAAVCSTELHSRKLLQKTAEDFLKQHGFSPDELCRPPSPADETCRAYCPRCNAQFTSAGSQCTDCGGLQVVEFT